MGCGTSSKALPDEDDGDAVDAADVVTAKSAVELSGKKRVHWGSSSSRSAPCTPKMLPTEIDIEGGNGDVETVATPKNEAQAATEEFKELAHQRLIKLEELDARTKVPFILIELTGEGNGEGEIEVCGKDEYGIYEALDAFFQDSWSCEKLDPGDLSLETKVPFCKAQYRWPGFATSGDEGLNNMGLMTMRLIDFVCSQLSWTLAVVNGGNVGKAGEVRETQVIFKAPHPMNLVVPHLMIEMRSAGFIEVCADLEEEHKNILDDLDAYFADRFKAEVQDGHEEFCDRYYKAGEDVFKGSSGSVDSNFGLLTVDICDKVVKDFPGWSLVAANNGNYGEAGEHCEQQLIFRRDEHPLGKKNYVLVTLNEQGNVEVNGKEVKSLQTKMDQWLRTKWKCSRAGHFREGETISRRYSWPQEDGKDLLQANAELVQFFEMEGFEIQVCSQQTVKEEGVSCKEMQLLFRQGASEVGIVEPHLFLDIYAGEGNEELYEDEEATQVLGNQSMRLRAIGPKDTRAAVEASLDGFIVDYLGGAKAEDMYKLNVFLCRGRFENNLAQWTMRLCDFLVDTLGWSFLNCSLCNSGELGQIRSQQLVFRFDGDKRDVPVSAMNFANLKEDFQSTPKPDYWKIPQVLDQSMVQKCCVCDKEEVDSLRTICDSTFQRILTRDRQPDEDAPEDKNGDPMEMPFRLDLLYAFRSENSWLHHRYEKNYSGRKHKSEADQYPVKTKEPETALSSRLRPGEAWLFHGTNPSSAMSILKTGFVLDHAGSARGTMFGYGVYLAEASSKSDEYGRDDGGNTYPSVNALLVCRAYVGKPYTVDKAGEYVEAAKANNADCILGDRAERGGVKPYKEYVFFDEAQIYPEFAIIYRRQWDQNEVPEELKGALCVPTLGTTGRYWQVSVERSYKNLPTEINKALIKALEDGLEEVELTWKETEYVFNVDKKKGTNKKSGKEVRLRPPYQA